MCRSLTCQTQNVCNKKSVNRESLKVGARGCRPVFGTLLHLTSPEKLSAMQIIRPCLFWVVVACVCVLVLHPDHVSGDRQLQQTPGVAQPRAHSPAPAATKSSAPSAGAAKGAHTPAPAPLVGPSRCCHAQAQLHALPTSLGTRRSGRRSKRAGGGVKRRGGGGGAKGRNVRRSNFILFSLKGDFSAVICQNEGTHLQGAYAPLSRTSASSVSRPPSPPFPPSIFPSPTSMSALTFSLSASHFRSLSVACLSLIHFSLQFQLELRSQLGKARVPTF